MMHVVEIEASKIEMMGQNSLSGILSRKVGVDDHLELMPQDEIVFKFIIRKNELITIKHTIVPLLLDDILRLSGMFKLVSIEMVER